MKSSPSLWHFLHNVKSTVKILSIFVAFSEKRNFASNLGFKNQRSHFCYRFVYLDWKRLKTVLTTFFAFEFLPLFKQIPGYFWHLLKLELTHVPIVLNWELQWEDLRMEVSWKDILFILINLNPSLFLYCLCNLIRLLWNLNRYLSIN